LVSSLTLLLISLSVYLFYIWVINSWTNSMQPGSSIGSIVNIEKEKYKDEYLKKYSDTFFKIYPQFKPLQDDRAKFTFAGYDFLKITYFYFNKTPRETYGVQWSGTGFVSIRFAYNYDKNEAVIENSNTDSIISVKERNRMSIRFRKEILDKIDSLITNSRDSSIAIMKPL
jgi:signal peptidase I